jgi:hypothetical protein
MPHSQQTARKSKSKPTKEGKSRLVEVQNDPVVDSSSSSSGSDQEEHMEGEYEGPRISQWVDEDDDDETLEKAEEQVSFFSTLKGNRIYSDIWI